MSAATLPRLTALLAALILPTTALSAQAASQARSDSYTWSLGLNGGMMTLRTPTQDAKFLPLGGAHLRIVANRTALVLGVDEIFGSEEESGLIRFNDVRRYQALLLAYPFGGAVEPYLGLGGSIMQVVEPRVSDIVSDPSTRAMLQSASEDAATFAAATAVAGLQGRWGRFNVFAQYQIGSKPNDSRLLTGVTHSVTAGIRIGLGSAREELVVTRD